MTFSSYVRRTDTFSQANPATGSAPHCSSLIQSIRGHSSPLGDESLLFTDRLDKFPTSWSPDGRFILFTARSPETDSDLWILPVNDDPKPYQFVHTPRRKPAVSFLPPAGG